MYRKATSIPTIVATVAIAALAGLTSQAAIAEDSSWDDRGWHIGINGGWSKANIDEERIRSGLLSGGFTTDALVTDESDSGYKLYAGYQFNRYFAIEGGYFDLGGFDYRATTTPAGSLDGSVEINGFNLDVIGIVPFSERFSMFGSVGANRAEAEAAFVPSGAVHVFDPNRSEWGTKVKFGVGARWAFTDRIAMRVEAERYRVNDAIGNTGDVDLLSIGMAFRFGGDRSPQVAEEPAPKRAAPIPVIVPAPATERYCSILDLQFEIDADSIQREDREKLRVLGTYLQKYPDTTALIEGHTDNVGSADDNQRLSQRRAESVVDFLANNYGISTSRLSAAGHGEMRPIANNDTQEGKRKNRRINAVIACVDDIAGLEPTPARITMALLIEFGHDDAVIDRRYHDDLRHVADFLKANPEVTATVEGHTGNATPARSVEISRLRAQNVADYLVENFGIARTRVGAEGFGETRPFAYNTTAEGRQENRRVNIVFNYPK